MSDPTPHLSEAVRRATEGRSKRTGPCVANGVDCPCEAFALVGREDGFPVCACTHTQWAHKEGTVEP